MKKPKCADCKAATKRIYHRKGKRGYPTPIKYWWYCEKCAKIAYHREREDSDDDIFIDFGEQKGYPKIKREQQRYDENYNAIVNDMSMTNPRISKRLFIKEAVKDRGFKQDWIDSTKFRYESKYVNCWVCSICNNIIENITLPIDDSKPMQPLHCDNEMKLAVLEVNQLYELKLSKLLTNIMQLVDSHDFDNAGFHFFELVILYFESYMNYNVYNSNFALETLYNLEEIKGDEIKGSWGYRMVECLFSIFEPKSHPILENHILEVIKVTGREKHPDPVVSPTNYTLDRFSIIFSDIISYLHNFKPQLTPIYRRKFFVIEKLIGMRSEALEYIFHRNEVDQIIERKK